jgi:hypothetical protein
MAEMGKKLNDKRNTIPMKIGISLIYIPANAGIQLDSRVAGIEIKEIPIFIGMVL